jgi:DNA-binding CsgD family transcriptional regulator
MDLVLVGRTSREIAATLGLSVRTVDGHRGRIFQKTGVTSAARLLATVLGNHP